MKFASLFAKKPAVEPENKPQLQTRLLTPDEFDELTKDKRTARAEVWYKLYYLIATNQIKTTSKLSKDLGVAFITANKMREKMEKLLELS